jgi:4-carboxymuconolactone decarboxylase
VEVDKTNDAATAPDLSPDHLKARRGYLLPHHRVLARWDPVFLAAYEEFVDASHFARRLLPEKTKDLLFLSVQIAVGAPPEILAAYIRRCRASGWSVEEIVEAFELVLLPAGGPKLVAAFAVLEDVLAADA